MPNYQLSKIYQLVCLTTGEKYIGSTTEPTLARRLAGHYKNYKKWKNDTYSFVSSFIIIERGNYQIELLETFPCNSKDELNAREGHYIRTVECVNRRIEGRTLKEWSDDNKEHLAEYRQTYREANKERIAESKKI
jgi:adenylate kinase family enzyme